MPDTSNDLPDDLIQTGAIHIYVVMGSAGTGTSFTYEDTMSLESAIGHVTVVLDRLKEEAAAKWDHCPGCGEPYEPLDDDPEGED